MNSDSLFLHIHGAPHRVGLVPPKNFVRHRREIQLWMIRKKKKIFPDEIVVLLKRPFVLFLITARKNKRVSHITHKRIAQKLTKEKAEQFSSLIGPLSLFFSLHFFFPSPHLRISNKIQFYIYDYLILFLTTISIRPNKFNNIISNQFF